jgi:hypothetical protein
MNASEQLKNARQLLQAAEFALNKIPNRPLRYGAYNETYDLLSAISGFLSDAVVMAGRQEIRNELQILEYIEINKRPLTQWERSRQAQLEVLLKNGGA